jgi:hypothetical protein
VNAILSAAMSGAPGGDGLVPAAVNVASTAWLVIVGVPQTARHLRDAIRVSRDKARAAEATHKARCAQRAHEHEENDR